jgi:hypothetical protein
LELDSYADAGLLASGVITTSGGLLINGPGSLNTMSPVQTASYTGEVDLTGANAVTGATTVNAAYLFLDYSKTGGNNSKVDPLSALTLNSSFLGLNGATTASYQACQQPCGWRRCQRGQACRGLGVDDLQHRFGRNHP